MGPPDIHTSTVTQIFWLRSKPLQKQLHTFWGQGPFIIKGITDAAGSISLLAFTENNASPPSSVMENVIF